MSPNPEKFYFDDKGPILDLKARDERGTFYNIEVQDRATDLIKEGVAPPLAEHPRCQAA